MSYALIMHKVRRIFHMSYTCNTVRCMGQVSKRDHNHYTPPAENPAPWPNHPGGPKYSDAEVEDLLKEMRGEH